MNLVFITNLKAFILFVVQYASLVILFLTGPFVPVNLPPENPLRLSLAETIFNKSAQQLQDYWNQRYFQGVAPPHVLRSQEAMVQFVAKTPGAIGYIAACCLDDRVREVLAIPVSPSQREAFVKLCSHTRNANQPN